MALAFISEAVLDKAYLQTMWEVTSSWRAHQVEALHKLFPNWRCLGEAFLSWVWIDTGSEEVAQKAVDVAKRNGTPIRWGKPGYRLPSYIRIAVPQAPSHRQHISGYHMHTHACTYGDTHSRTHIHTRAHTYLHVHTHTHACTYTRAWTQVRSPELSEPLFAAWAKELPTGAASPLDSTAVFEDASVTA